MLTASQKYALAAPVLGGLREIGYRPGLIARDYMYADLFSTHSDERQVDIAAFGQEPFDYRSCCIGVRMEDRLPETGEQLANVRSLGAPQLFVVTPETTQRWNVLEGGVQLGDVFPTYQFNARATAHKEQWNPTAMLRAKTGFDRPSPQQLDLVDIGLLSALDAEAGKKIDQMVSRILHQVESICAVRGEPFDAHSVFGVLFRLLAAKLLRDRAFVTTPPIDFSNPEQTLLAVDNHYRKAAGARPATLSRELLSAMADETASSFSFRNISVDTLTYVYENTFVSPSSRKSFGIHSTPSSVADYVLSQIPVESLPRDQWSFIDPTCGHGIFLIAAMRRIRHLLPASWGGARRHKFFTDHLIGVDIERFSIEVARLCLMLADFPEPNGWNLQCRDLFQKGSVEKAAQSAMIMIGNPPFENLPGTGPQKSAPAELLDRSLTHITPGGFLGLDLPKSFQDSVDYSKQRERLLQNYDVLSLTSLPDRVFLHSDAETVVVVAQRRLQDRPRPFAVYRDVRDKDRAAFMRRQTVSWEDRVPQSFFVEESRSSLVVPALRQIWERLGANARLSSIADIHKGVEYDTRMSDGEYDHAILDRASKDTARGVHKSSKALTQYVLFETQHFKLDPSLRRREAWSLPWHSQKVIAPAARHSRGPWRFAAVVDQVGLYASRLHYAMWPLDPQISVEVIAAILNSPIGAAYAFAHGTQKTVAK